MNASGSFRAHSVKLSGGWLHRLETLWDRLVGFSSAHKRLTASFIFGLALLLRSLYIISLPQSLSFDEPHYQDIVSHLLTGQGYSFSSDAYYTAVAGQPTSFQEPMYPLLLSVLHMVFGLENYLAVRLCQAVLGSLIPVMVFLLGEKVMGRGIGLVAGLLLVAYPSLIYFSGLLMTETLFIFLLVTSLYMLSWVIEATPGYRDVAFGALVGSAILTRTVGVGNSSKRTRSSSPASLFISYWISGIPCRTLTIASWW
jgi:4-amino-4-deoxy-L-arabinose transferase-like glycosyltransferase